MSDIGMSDQEMLELAAKARGGIVRVDGMGDSPAWIHEDENGQRGAWWNPIDDDGDAFDLLVHLHLDLTISDRYAQVRGSNACIYSNVWHGACSSDLTNPLSKNAAARLAIVRAAAQIGKAMP